MVISGCYVVTVHHEPCDELDGLRSDFAARRGGH